MLKTTDTKLLVLSGSNTFQSPFNFPENTTLIAASLLLLMEMTNTSACKINTTVDYNPSNSLRPLEKDV